MIRTILLLLTFISALHAHAHPLAGAIHKIAAVGVELNSVPKSERTDALKEKTYDLWMEAILTQINKANDQLNKTGVKVVLSKAPNALPQTYEIEVADQDSLLASAKQFNPSRWEDILHATESYKQAVDDGNKLLLELNASQGIPDDFIYRVRSQLHPNRMAALAPQYNISKRAIGCIDYFSNQFSKSGLRPIKGVNGAFAWDERLLQEKYDVARVEEIAKPVRPQVHGQISEMLSKGNSYRWICVDREVGFFFVNELKKLQ
ncbi:MAG: hypothetical protein HC883_01545 [Bdellovibrionaceae bacterium]|nr:hypothetical protein [Pseudobdellovibrionaceae bacterium]